MKNKIGISLFAIIIFLGFSGVCSAAAIVTDDFNGYRLGNRLSGQGIWIEGFSIVDNSVVYEGAAAVKLDSSQQGTIMRTKGGALLNDGSQTFHIRTNGDSMWIRLREWEMSDTATQKIWVSVNGSLPGKIAYYDADVSSWVAAADFSIDTWHAVSVQWRSVDHKVRYRVDNGAWSPYLTTSGTGPWVSGLDVVYIQTGVSGGTGNLSYVDAIKEVDERTPVLIVPGLLGTQMQSGNELLWSDLERMFTDIGDEFMDPLSFDSNLGAIDAGVSSSGVIKTQELPAYTFDYANGLLEELKNQGHIEDESLFTFPYDWRYGVTGKYADNKTNPDLLGEKIQQILTQTGADKVDLVAHSLGGLVTKKYVADHPAGHNIGRAVFVGVPNTGALKSVKALLEGDNFGIPWLSEAEMKKLSKHMPAAYDLLPTQKYYDVKGSFVEVIDQGEILHFFDATEKELNYSEFGDFITSDHHLNSQALTNAMGLHTAEFDDFDLRSAGVDVYAINGCKAGTLAKIVENRSKDIFGNTLIEYRNVSFKPGDETVPLESATNLPIDQDHAFYSLTGKHGKMLSQEGSRQQIVNVLAGSSLTTGDHITQDIDKCELNGRAISVFSPIDILVTDQFGHQAGNGDDGSILNEIPNASFEMFGEHTFLYLPTDEGQAYIITIRGTGAGTFTITSQDIIDSQVMGAQVFSNLAVTPELLGEIHFGNNGDAITLNIQETPASGSKIILPSATLDAAQAQDFLPPQSVVTLTGAQDSEGNYTEDVTVLISSTDENSGILNVAYSLDGADFVKISADTAAFTITSEGSHDILFFSTDKAGNNESKQAAHFVIKKPAAVAPVVVEPIVVTPVVVTPAAVDPVIEAPVVAAPTAVAPVVVASVSGGGGNNYVGGGNAPVAESVLSIPPVEAKQNLSDGGKVLGAAIGENKPAPTLAPKPVATKKPIKKVAMKKVLKVAAVPAATPVVKNDEPVAAVAVENPPPVAVAAENNGKSGFLASIYDLGSWIIKIIFKR